MAAKQADMTTKAISAVAGVAASFVTRKLLAFAWTRIAGKEPPEHPEDPQVALGEALLWGAVMGVGVGTARLLVTRVAGRKLMGAPMDDDQAED